VFGFLAVNGAFFYGVLFEPDAISTALANPLAGAFIAEALVLVGVFAYLFERWEVSQRRLRYRRAGLPGYSDCWDGARSGGEGRVRAGPVWICEHFMSANSLGHSNTGTSNGEIARSAR